MVKGLYIHIPYCSIKCHYCDFFSVVSQKDESYFDMLIEELKMYSFEYNIKTIYFGGGTPSIFNPRIYESFFKKLKNLINLDNVEEITMELNPRDYNYEDFKILKDIGINRLSFGIQSFNESSLKWLGREHDLKDAIMSIETAKKLFDNISIDIIWGIPNQSLKDFEKDINMALFFDLSHLSFYMLTFYQDTILYDKKQHEKSEEEISLFYELLEKKLTSYIHYEISNFAKKDFLAKHNLIYWNYEDYLGLGAGASSKVDKFIFSNPKSIEAYKEKVHKRAFNPTIISEEDDVKNKIMMGLRTMFGVDKNLIKIPKHLKEYFKEDKNRVSIKKQYWLISNYLIASVI